MSDEFFTHPILNPPYEYSARHWELEPDTHQPTGYIIEPRRSAEFITPIPKPKKQKGPPANQAQRSSTRECPRSKGFAQVGDVNG